MRVTERLTSSHAGLLIIDLQEKLLQAIADRQRIVARTLGLIQAAKILAIPFWTTEQYPKGLGPTTEPIAACVGDRLAKTSFHCATAGPLIDGLRQRDVKHVTLAGIEAHVCVAQTALELMDRGYRVQIAADAVGSRRDLDRDLALRRLELAGAVVSSTDAVIFEWTETAARPEFKPISQLIKELDQAQA